MHGTTQRAYRLPTVQIEAVKEAIATGLPDIHNVTDAVVDALWLWLYENSKANGKVDGGQERAPVGAQTENGQAMSEAGRDRTQNSPDTSPATVDPPEPTEADHPYTGHQERPKWADVDPAVLDVGD